MIFINGIQETNVILNSDNTIALALNDQSRQSAWSQENISTTHQICYQIRVTSISQRPMKPFNAPVMVSGK
jgi:hypothetical protein